MELKNCVLLLRFRGGGQNLERLNVERPVFQNFEIANIWVKVKIPNSKILELTRVNIIENEIYIKGQYEN